MGPKCVRGNLNIITVHGGWGKWGEWALCSATCGGGKRTRKQSCDNPAPAYGGNHCSFEELKRHEYEEGDIKVEASKCNTKICPGRCFDQN